LGKQLDCLKEENSKLKSENLCLKTENKDLTERTNNLSYILADLQGKTKNAEEERDSLITAMRLLGPVYMEAGLARLARQPGKRDLAV
jgi:regulator of replication initiation timing